VTAYPTQDSTQAGALEVVWRELGPQLRPELRPTPPYGFARPPRSRPRTAPCLREVRQLPGRSEHTPRAARAFVVDTCRLWRVSRGIVEDLALIVSELTTNAVVHAPGERVTVAVLLTATEVWVVVVDQGPRRRVAARPAGADDEHGRGLHLVEVLAARAGVLPARGGTAVWACLKLPARRTAAEAGAPAVHAPTHDGTDSPHTPKDAPDAPRTHL
jgi:anti-sigma regulatory factor (Ser/Thr protein kinase)